MNKTFYFPSKYHSRVFKIAICIFLFLLIFKLSGQDLSKPITRGLLPLKNDNGLQPIKVDGKVLSSDTTKPTINHRYVLKGSDTMFILLQNLILSPDDVTPRQKNIVVDWFRQNVKIDSTKK